MMIMVDLAQFEATGSIAWPKLPCMVVEFKCVVSGSDLCEYTGMVLIGLDADPWFLVFGLVVFAFHHAHLTGICA